MKEVKKIIISLVVLALCLGIGQLSGLRLREFITNVKVDINSLLKVLAIVAAVMAIKNIVKTILNSFKQESTVLTITRSLIDYIAVILAVVWSLRILGADINGIIAGLGILGLIIGMSAQDIINDLMTGLFLLFEQEYKVGDYIEVNGFSGKVTEIGVRTTAITDAGGNEKIINNSAMKNILNKSSYQSVAVVDLELPKTVDVKEILNRDYGDIQCLGLEAIKGDKLVFRFVKECAEKDVYNVRREMNVELLEKVK